MLKRPIKSSLPEQIRICRDVKMNLTWQYKKIGDVCIVERGGSPRPIDQYITENHDGINWIKIGDTDVSMFITKTAQKILPEGMKKSRYVQPGDFLLSNSMSFGRPYILKIDGCIHDGWLVLRDKDNLFDKRFLYYYLSAKPTYQKFKMMAVGGVVNNLNSEMVRNLEVPIPCKNEQIKIAGLLDKANAIIIKKKREISILDDLIKARFVEMFGDPETNPKGWNQVTIGDVCKSIVRGPFGSALKKEFFVEPNETTYKVYEQKHAIQKSATIGTYYVTEDKYKELKRFECVAGDILMSCSGTMGELYQLPQGCERGIINQALCKFTLNEKILPICFLTYMKQTIGHLETKGSGIQNIAAVSFVKAMPINLPPMDIQKKFASFVYQIDKSKVVVQKSLEQTQLLFDSLMQQYFG